MAAGKPGARTRALAAETVDAVVTGGRSLDAALDEAAARLPASELPLLRALCYGVLRRYWSLDASLSQFLEKRLKRRDRVVEALILVGFYQLSEMRIPAHAAVSETVEATRLLGRQYQARLVNAVLRRFTREEPDGTAAASATARYNHPEWIIGALEQDWPDDWRAILDANNERAPMWLRVNLARTTRAEYLSLLASAGIEVAPDAPLAETIRLAAPVAMTMLPGFDAGLVSVQDAAAQLAAPWLLEGGAANVLDACAAPGGKSAHLKEVGGPSLRLTCIDIDAARVAMIGETMARLGHEAIVMRGDASDPGSWHDGRPCDAILLDAPCSASGVIRRHPDIKHLRRPADIDRLAALQAAILRALWPLLAPGGRLLYVTCSVFARENDAVVGKFLEESDDAVENKVLHNNNIRALMRRKAFGFQLLPGTSGMDGFYFACLEKVS